MPPPDLVASASRLCTACGLCCNGVLFEIVRLQPSDSVEELASLGMEIGRKKRGPYFKQPCSFLAFRCAQIEEVATETLTEEEALRTIVEAKRRVQEVEELLEQAGNKATGLPLAERYGLAVASVDPEAIRGQPLVLAMDRLQEWINEFFRVDPPRPPV
ncbi:MAG: hypothetical protein NTX04_05655 [Verrucomicrobia bacterium]|nr:hypothetical protein [Verrucomicrobiota bacterium]